MTDGASQSIQDYSGRLEALSESKEEGDGKKSATDGVRAARGPINCQYARKLSAQSARPSMARGAVAADVKHYVRASAITGAGAG